MTTKIDYKKYLKKSGWIFLIIILICFVFMLLINNLDVNNLDIKNSNKRKITDKYSDENMEKLKNKFSLYKKTKNKKIRLKEKIKNKKKNKTSKNRRRN